MEVIRDDVSNDVRLKVNVTVLVEQASSISDLLILIL